MPSGNSAPPNVFAASLNYDYKRKSKRIQCCEFNHCAGAGARKFCLSTSVIRERIFFSFLLSITLLVISSGCLRPASALEYANKSSEMNDNTEKDSSADYDYVENVEPSSEAEQIMQQSTDTHLNRYSNQTQTEHTDPQDDAQNNGERNPSEIQKAVCTITAGEVRASAEAVTTKTLKGVCGSAELQLAVSNLEAKIFKELAYIRTLLLQEIASKQQQPTNCNCVMQETKASKETSTQTTPTKSALKPISVPQHNNAENIALPKLKSLKAPHQNQLQSRDKEVSKFNNTMLADKDVKIFSYYWRLENFTARIESGFSVNIDSPRFAIKGKPLHLKAYFQHLHRDFLYLQLQYATSPAKGSSASNRSSSPNNIILDMGLLGGGSLFKAISSNDQILFKYKISILDQQNLRLPKDLVSQEFHNLDNGFLVPNSALLGSPYIKNDTLLIQLFLYL